MAKINAAATIKPETKERIPYKWRVLFIVAISTLNGTLDAHVLNISFPTIARNFHTDPATVLWVSVTYLLVSSGLMLPFGQIGDTIGRKKVYAAGFAVFTLGLALNGLTQNVGQLILTRAFQGVGASMVLANGNALVTAAFPSTERGKALGILSAVAGVGQSLGPAIGGILVDTFDWRFIFFFRIPIGLIGTIAALLVLRESARRQGKFSFDFIGAISLFLSIAGILFALSQGVKAGFGSPLIIAAATVAVLAIPVFLWQERRAAQPVVNLRFFQNRTFSSAVTSAVVNFFAIATYNFLTPFYLTQGIGLSSSQAGLVMLAVPLSRLTVTPFSGWLSDKTGSRVLSTTGMAMLTIGFILYSRLAPLGQVNLLIIVAVLVLLGSGEGVFDSPNNSAIMGSVPRENLGTASATTNTVRQLGLSSGIATAGAVFSARQGFHASQLQGTGELTNELRTQSVLEGFQDAILIAAFFAALGILTSLVREQQQK